MPPDIHGRLAAILMDIEEALVETGFWAEEPPSAEALQSDQPFCVDTLEFPQWVQFVMLERLTLTVEQRGPLPTASAIAPMAEEYFRPLPENGEPLIAALRRFDRLIASGEG